MNGLNKGAKVANFGIWSWFFGRVHGRPHFIGKWREASGIHHFLVVVDDYSRYAWVLFLQDKSETFGFVRDLIVRLKNERHGNAIRAIHSDDGSEFKNSRFDAFCRDLGLEHQYSTPFVPLKMELWKEKIGLFVRWLGQCSMSTGLLGGIGLRRSIQLVMFPTGFYCELSRRRPVMSLCMVGLPR
jgi:hypothetical protein